MSQGVAHLPGLVENQAQKVQGLGMVGLAREDVTANGRRPFQVTRLVKLEAAPQLSGQAVHTEVGGRWQVVGGKWEVLYATYHLTTYFPADAPTQITASTPLV